MTRRAYGFVLAVLVSMLVLTSTHATAPPPQVIGEPSVDPARPWAHHLEAVDRALARQDARTAVRAWHDAYSAARASRKWEGMMETGAAYIRIGRVTGIPDSGMPTARQFYLTGLFRARGERSLDGVLQAAQAFAVLGDRDVVDQCLRIAAEIAGTDPQAVAKVNTFKTRWEEGVLASPKLP